MLTHIQITDYVLVHHLELTLGNGLLSLTGETGAGKSLIIDTINLALGNRADVRSIRHNAAYCEIICSFDCTHLPQAQAWLAAHDLNNDNQQCIIQRRIKRQGNSRCMINQKPCTLNMLRTLAPLLIHIHGQHQHTQLLKATQQRYTLDAFANSTHLADELLQQYQCWQQTNHQLAELKQQAEQREHQLALLRYQHDELTAAELEPNEWQRLHAEHQQLHQAKALIEQLNLTLDYTLENERASAASLLQQALDQAQEMVTSDQQIDAAKQLLSTALIHLEEANNELTQFRNTLDLSPERLHTIEQRLTLIHDLARKHHVNPEDLDSVVKSIGQQIIELDNLDTQLRAVQLKAEQLAKHYHQLAQQLSQHRQQASQPLAGAITTALQTLGMPGAQLTIQVDTDTSAITNHGYDRIEFVISTNPGQPFGPLNKIVSGGELSRLSLALQVVTRHQDHPVSIVFDEVDVGVGGKTAETVGKLLRQLGEKTQVICITHLAQVCAQAHQHLLVSKTTHEQHTQTHIQLLTKKQRIDEVARMISGSKISSESLAHAAELIAQD